MVVRLMLCAAFKAIVWVGVATLATALVLVAFVAHWVATRGRYVAR